MKDLLIFVVSVSVGFITIISIGYFFTFDFKTVLFVSILVFAALTPLLFKKGPEADHIKQEDLLKRSIIALIGFLIGCFFSYLIFIIPNIQKPYEESKNLKMYEQLIEKESAGLLEHKQTIRGRYCNDQSTKLMGDNWNSCSLVGDVKDRDTCLFCWGTLEISPKNQEICDKLIDKTLLLECMSYNDFYMTPISR